VYLFIANHQIERYFPSITLIEVVEKPDIEAIIVASPQRRAKDQL
jgi:hypothetical protein